MKTLALNTSPDNPLPRLGRRLQPPPLTVSLTDFLHQLDGQSRRRPGLGTRCRCCVPPIPMPAVLPVPPAEELELPDPFEEPDPFLPYRETVFRLQ